MPKSPMVLLLLLMSCQTADRAPRHGNEYVALDQVIEWRDSLTLTENPDVVNVLPNVVAESDGFIVIDPRESQGRLYDLDGGLKRAFGRLGKGPGEFTNPMGALRLEDDRIVVIEFDGRLTILDSKAGEVLHTTTTGMLPVYGLQSLGRGELLIQGRLAGQLTGPMLHVWDLVSGSLIRSFFGPLEAERRDPRLAPLTWPAVRVHRDTILAVAAMTDTLYVFDRTGAPLETLRIPFAGFTGSEGIPASNAEVMNWVSTLWKLTDIFVVSDSILLLQTEQVVGRDVHHRLLAMTRRGRRLFEVANTPRLLAAIADRLYFVSPTSDTPNRWYHGQLSRPRQ